MIKLKSALYNPTTDTVTLTPRKPFALTKPVQLLVEGEPPSGLEDSLGRLIDGDHNGQAGGNAVAVLSRGGATLSAGVYHPTDARRSRTRLLDPAAGGGTPCCIGRRRCAGAIAVKDAARAERALR